MKTLIIALLMMFTAPKSFADPVPPYMEPLLGTMTSLEGVHIQVRSRGCTSKDSFLVKKEKNGATMELRFIRVENDPCLALLLYGEILSYSFEELGLNLGEKFIVRNPITFSKVR